MPPSPTMPRPPFHGSTGAQLLVGACAAVASAAAVQPTRAQAGPPCADPAPCVTFIFYEKNGPVLGRPLGVVHPRGLRGPIWVTAYGIPNDQARAVEIYSAPVGTELWVYDDRDGRTRGVGADNYVRVTACATVTYARVDSFERQVVVGPLAISRNEPPSPRSTGNLDGKISTIEIRPPRGRLPC